MLKTRVSTTLAIAAAMAIAGGKMPESAKTMAMGLAHKPRPTPKPNRHQRRAMAAKLSHTPNTTGSKLVRKASQGKL